MFIVIIWTCICLNQNILLFLYVLLNDMNFILFAVDCPASTCRASAVAVILGAVAI